jgi:hypothetical protein
MDDLTGMLLRSSDDWTLLSLPAIASHLARTAKHRPLDGWWHIPSGATAIHGHRVRAAGVTSAPLLKATHTHRRKSSSMIPSLNGFVS